MSGILGFVLGKNGLFPLSANWDAASDRLRSHEQNMDAPPILDLGCLRTSLFNSKNDTHQPLYDFQGNSVIFDGKIYNHTILRAELIRLGHEFQTDTDEEIILMAYSQWGMDCVRRFNGIWAFALYDRERQCLFCSRDRMGVKPFYCAVVNDSFVFASTPEAILLLLGRQISISRNVLARYVLSGNSFCAPECLYNGISELSGGQSGVFDLELGAWKTHTYWQLASQPDLELDDVQALDQFEELLEDAVRLRLSADLPVSLTLSGGVDSSALAVAASRLGAPITAYTSHFPDFKEADESQFAAMAAAAGKLEHVLIPLTFKDLLTGEEEWTRAQGMPFSSLSGYVHWSVIEAVHRQDVRIVLSGQGGDELFWGYESYLPRHIFDAISNPFEIWRRWKIVSQRTRLSWMKIPMLFLTSVFPKTRSYAWLKRAERVFDKNFLMNGMANLSRDDCYPLDGRQEYQRLELTRRVLPRLLLQDSRNSARHGIETRLPFLDHRLVEFAYRLPPHHTMRNGWTKFLVRRYLERHGLPKLAWRTHKKGFNCPQEQWQTYLWRERGEKLLRQPIAHEILRNDFISSESRSGKHSWHAYNILHLAQLGNWVLE